MKPGIYIGTAGWSFPDEGTHLQRYAQIFNAVKLSRYFTQEMQLKVAGPKLNETPWNPEI